ncbi:MAG: ATP-binding cassette domain-containing protein [Rhodococcus sp. (in: high G+C Gram-positive bacteria)]|nr:MAG: ATP-binding cassette domain-containing protein [Rhodococcus sp. (in: high G+C Gram-positive bacteria)]
MGQARHLLEQLGLAERIKARPGALSTGQCQRVCLARALVEEMHSGVNDLDFRQRLRDHNHQLRYWGGYEFEARQLAGSYWNARTSCAHRQAAAIFAAHPSAASREGSSSTV